MKYFLNCKIDVSKKVFAPRPETEFWTKLALREIKKSKEKKIDVLDIFAGSGAIGIAVLKNVENSFCDFVDIDERALSQIKINLRLNNIEKNRYRIIKSYLFEKISKRYDFILANPPYVALERLAEVQRSVLEEEPHLALFAGKDGLDCIKIFLKEVKKYLRSKPSKTTSARYATICPDEVGTAEVALLGKGKFYLEFDPQQKEEIREICKKKGLKFKFHKDQFKKWRFLIGSK